MLKKYYDYLLVNGMTENTIKNYIYRIKILLNKLKIEELNEDNIIQYLLELRSEHSPSTINGHKYTIQSFLNFLKLKIILPKNIKISRKLPKIITEEFFEKNIISNLDIIFQDNILKIKAILYFMFYTGLRKSELPTLKRKDIDLKSGIFKIYRQKTKEERMSLIVGKKTKNIVTAYFTSEAEENNAFNTTVCSIDYIFKTINSYLTEVNFHPHLARHFFATFLRQNEINIENIQHLLGHKSIISTMIYAQPDIKAIKEICDIKIK